MPNRFAVIVVASLVLSASIASLVVRNTNAVDDAGQSARSGYIVASS